MTEAVKDFSKWCKENNKEYLLTEWDYDKNAGLLPKDVSKGSSKKVWWKCSKGHSWPSRVSHRANGAGCPYCKGNLVIPGETDLLTTHPELCKEWDYERNTMKPQEVTAGLSKKAHWICGTCKHRWFTRINHRVNNIGCPECGKKKSTATRNVTLLDNGKNSFETWCNTNGKATLLEEWDTKKNEGLTPADFTSASHKKVWWTCGVCEHKYPMAINNRRSGQGCPECSKGRSTSYAEQVVYLVLKQHYKDAESRTKIQGFEFDVFIPTLNLLIEYDGLRWHNTARKKIVDEKKTELAKVEGYNFLRIKETKELALGIATLEEGVIQYKPSSIKDKNLTVVLERLSVYIAEQFNVSLYLELTENLTIKVLENLRTMQKENSLAAKNPRVAAEWHPTKNGKLTPDSVAAGSGKRVWWKCKKGHEWDTTVKQRAMKGGTNCPYCSGKLIIPGETDLATTHPELCKEWDYEKNDITPDEVTRGSNKKVYWKCKVEHEWVASITNRATKGSGCKKCDQNSRIGKKLKKDKV